MISSNTQYASQKYFVLNAKKNLPEEVQAVLFITLAGQRNLLKDTELHSKDLKSYSDTDEPISMMNSEIEKSNKYDYGSPTTCLWSQGG